MSSRVRVVNQNWWFATLMVNARTYCPPPTKDFKCGVLIGGVFSGSSSSGRGIEHIVETIKRRVRQGDQQASPLFGVKCLGEISPGRHAAQSRPRGEGVLNLAVTEANDVLSPASASVRRLRLDKSVPTHD